MRGSGFRVDVSELRRKAAKLGREVDAMKFLPDLKQFVRVSLNTAVKLTPARSLATIKTNQSRQYDNRINYIPSVHELVDPTLIVKPDGMWLYCSGNWYKPNERNVPDDVWSAFETLLAEHLRRMDTPKDVFIKERAQARFLYKRQLVQCGGSIGLQITAPPAVYASHTRRKPPVEPLRGYAQVRGGKQVVSVVIYLPSIDDSNYRTWDMGDIMTAAISKHRPAFLKAVQKHLQRIAYAVFNS